MPASAAQIRALVGATEHLGDDVVACERVVGRATVTAVPTLAFLGNHPGRDPLPRRAIASRGRARLAVRTPACPGQTSTATETEALRAHRVTSAPFRFIAHTEPGVRSSRVLTGP